MNAPPKRLNEKVRDRARTQDGRVVVRRTGTAVATAQDTSASLPVLEAFHDFLERERRRSRRRLVAVSLVFTLLLLMLSGVMVYLGIQLMERTQADVIRLQTEVATLQQALADTAKAEDARRLAQSMTNLSASVASTSHQTVEHAKQAVRVGLGGVESEVETLRSLVADVKRENAWQVAALRRLKSEWDVINQELIAARSQTETPTTQVNDARDSVETASFAPPVTLMVVPVGSTSPVPWQIPIPE